MFPRWHGADSLRTQVNNVVRNKEKDGVWVANTWKSEFLATCQYLYLYPNVVYSTNRTEFVFPHHHVPQTNYIPYEAYL